MPCAHRGASPSQYATQASNLLPPDASKAAFRRLGWHSRVPLAPQASWSCDKRALSVVNRMLTFFECAHCIAMLARPGRDGGRLNRRSFTSPRLSSLTHALPSPPLPSAVGLVARTTYVKGTPSTARPSMATTSAASFRWRPRSSFTTLTPACGASGGTLSCSHRPVTITAPRSGGPTLCPRVQAAPPPIRLPRHSHCVRFRGL